jgi:ABC-type glycerol-3-phosphate transport system substrate-binding protein
VIQSNNISLKREENRDAAWKAIQVMTGPDAEKYLAGAGRAFAARKDFRRDWYDTAAQDVVGVRDACPRR